MIKRILTIFFILSVFLTYSSQIFGQEDRAVDSLKNEISKAEGGQKVKLLNQISKQYWSISPDSSLHFAKEALRIAQKINDDAGISDALNRMGNAHFFLGNKEKSLSYYKNSLELRKKLNDPEKLIQIYNNLSVYYANLRNLEKSNKFYHKALKISK